MGQYVLTGHQVPTCGHDTDEVPPPRGLVPGHEAAAAVAGAGGVAAAAEAGAELVPVRHGGARLLGALRPAQHRHLREGNNKQDQNFL